MNTSCNGLTCSDQISSVQLSTELIWTWPSYTTWFSARLVLMRLCILHGVRELVFSLVRALWTRWISESRRMLDVNMPSRHTALVFHWSNSFSRASLCSLPVIPGESLPVKHRCQAIDHVTRTRVNWVRLRELIPVDQHSRDNRSLYETVTQFHTRFR